QDKQGEAEYNRILTDFKIISPNGRVAAAIRKLDLLGETLLLTKVKGSWRLTEADLEAREAYKFYRDHAARVGDNEIYGCAVTTSWVWLLQFNHAAQTFIRGQACDLGLTILEEEELRIREKAEV